MGIPPTILLEPKIAQYGSSIELETAVEADPAPAARWVKEDQPVPENDLNFEIKLEPLKFENMYRLILQIKEFDKPHAGLYKCFIENEHGKTTASFAVTTGDLPDFVDKPHIVQREKGKLLTIKIKAKSKTEMTIEWTKNDEPVTENERIKFLSKPAEEPDEWIYLLEIKDPTKDDESKYKCTIRNEYGTNSQSLNLVFE